MIEISTRKYAENHIDSITEIKRYQKIIWLKMMNIKHNLGIKNVPFNNKSNTR